MFSNRLDWLHSLHPQTLVDWLNNNQGVVGVALFLATLLFGWASGIFQALRRRPKFRFRLIDGPTFVCTFGVNKQHGQYQVHRTGMALYLDIANIGSASSSIREIRVGYHWALKPFGKSWWKYSLGWFQLSDQVVCLSDFQVLIGENVKLYPFLIQKSGISGASADTYLEVGKSTNGVVYFEQTDSWGACFPVSIGGKVRVKIAIEDAFGRWHRKKVWLPKVSLLEAQKFNPSFGLTHASLHGEECPFELPVDAHGNILPPENPN